ncbi:hypothetical protein E2C01_098059 [Portunus trituberculatus]|uniref:Uncharacterized protein n=1 Tax=Portunus trituberculatus TaxID=210409 RepID=A0A5B7K794_PORTR|nr:hypothetical protein [Portunus trituberculatus]
MQDSLTNPHSATPYASFLHHATPCHTLYKLPSPRLTTPHPTTLFQYPTTPCLILFPTASLCLTLPHPI